MCLDGTYIMNVQHFLLLSKMCIMDRLDIFYKARVKRGLFEAFVASDTKNKRTLTYAQNVYMSS